MIQRWMKEVRGRTDRGMTTVELIVAISISVVVLGVAAMVAINVMRGNTDQEQRREAMAQMEGSSKMLMESVRSASSITKATPTELTLSRVIDEVCVVQEFVARDGVLTVTNRTYGGESCSGGSQDVSVESATLLTADEVFSYFSGSGSTEMTQPVEVKDVKVVGWTFDRLLPQSNKTVAYESAESFRGSGVRDDGTGNPNAVSMATELRVITDTYSPAGVIGITNPTIEWTDNTAAAVSSWTVYRVAGPEGQDAGTSWQVQTVVTNPSETETSRTMQWTDPNLPAGHTATYLVRSNPRNGTTGPTSNRAVTGMRPDAPAGVTAEGRRDSILVGWTAQEGATRYDVYRDGQLHAQWSTIKDDVARDGNNLSWVDPTGFGHAHFYTVVASNRWELSAIHPEGAWASNSQTREPAVGTRLTDPLGVVGKMNARLAPQRAGAFSAPVTPDLNQMVNQQPADVNNPASVWNPAVNLSWIAAAWQGDNANAARSATRYTVTRGGETIVPRTTSLSGVDQNAPRGADITWTLVADAGETLKGEPKTRNMMTYPSSPVCSVALGTPTTSTLVVAITAPSGETITGSRARLHSRATLPADTTYNGTPRAVGYMVNGPNATFTQVAHTAVTKFRSQAQNAGGYGPWSGADCAGVTAAESLGITVSLARGNTTGAQTTRAATGAMSFVRGGTYTRTLTPGTNGAANSTTTSNTPSWNQLRHNTNHTLRVTNSDGFNTLTKSASVTTHQLTGTLALARGNATGAQTTRALTSTTTSTHATSSTIRLTPGTNGAANSSVNVGTAAPISGKTVWNQLRHNTNHTLSGTFTDGYNTITATAATRGTANLTGTLTISRVAAQSTRAVTVKTVAALGTRANISMSPGNDGASSTAAAINAGNSGVNDSRNYTKLRDNVNHTVSGTVTDGYNTANMTAKSVRTNELTGSLSLARVSTNPTRALKITLTSAHATSQSTRLTPGNDGASRSDSTAKTKTYTKLADGTEHRVTGSVSDGFNTSNLTADTASTYTLPNPSIELESRSTKRIVANLSVGTWRDGTKASMKISGKSYGTYISSGNRNYSYDNLTHNRSHTFTARVTDGYNVRTENKSLSTLVLTGAAAACTTSQSSTYVPTTIRFSATTSNTTMSRTSVYTSSAGTFSATATRTTTDGHNTVRRTGSCSRTVAARPWVTVGSPAASSSVCAPYRGHGNVVSLLNSAQRSGMYSAPGLTVGTSLSGSSAADAGAHVSGTVAARTLTCNFSRSHRLVDSFGNTSGTAYVKALWNIAGIGGI